LVETNFTRNVDCVGQAGGYSSRLFARLGKRTGYIGRSATITVAAWCATRWRATASI